MANRRTRSSKIQKIDEDSDFDQEFDQEFGPSQESVPSEGEQQRKYALWFVYPESTSIIRLITFFISNLLSGLLQPLKVSS